MVSSTVKSSSKKRASFRKDSKYTSNLMKTKYPKSDFHIHPSTILQNCEDLSHRTVLIQLLNQICESEKEDLHSFVDRFKSSDNHEKITLSFIDKIISESNELIEEVKKSCPNDIKFTPEWSHEEREELHSLTNLRNSLKTLSNKLDIYEKDNNLTTLANENNLWLGSSCQPFQSRLELMRETTKDKSSTQKTLLEATENLKKLEKSRVILDTKLTEVESIAKKAKNDQASLYDKFNKVRHAAASTAGSSSSSSTTVPPNNPKDILRQMPNLF